MRCSVMAVRLTTAGVMTATPGGAGARNGTSCPREKVSIAKDTGGCSLLPRHASGVSIRTSKVIPANYENYLPCFLSILALCIIDSLLQFFIFLSYNF